MNQELSNIQQFFTPTRIKCFRVTEIEKEAKLPPKTLDHFLKGRRQLNANHIKALIPVLEDFVYKKESKSQLELDSKDEYVIILKPSYLSKNGIIKPGLKTTINNEIIYLAPKHDL